MLIILLRVPSRILRAPLWLKKAVYYHKGHKGFHKGAQSGLIILITLLAFSSGFSQIKDAQREISLYNYSKAIVYLQNALKSKNMATRKEATLLLAECYRKQNDIPNTKIFYEKAFGFGKIAPDTWYYYAQALRSLANYTEAKKLFLKYDSLVPGDPRGKIYALYCDSAISWQKKQHDFSVGNVSEINSPQSEFGTVFYDKEIVFASDRILSKAEDKTYGWTGHNYLRLFRSLTAESDSVVGLLKKPQPFTVTGDQRWHEGPVSFNIDHSEIFINRTLLLKDPGKKDPGNIRTHLLKIYITSKSDGKWSNPESFFLNSSDFSVGHPALSPDGHTLFFISDMPGGHGGTDIYYCVRKEGKWSEPKNLGDIVNTFGNEMFPFVAANGDLYFASDGLPGFGGLDLFITRKVNRKWTNPENLGEPLNSSFDDFSLATRDNGKNGYFSTNRPGGSGNDDIYSFSPLSTLSPPSPPPPLFISGLVKDKSTLEPIPQASVFLLDQNRETVIVLRTDEKGSFRTQIVRGGRFLCKAAKSSYIPDCLLFSPDSAEYGNELSLPRILLLDRLEINKKLVLEDIYYDFDKWNIRPDAEPSLDKLVRIMKENPVNAELGSHTDCRGSDEYNRILSQKRAESAVEYIVKLGIDPSRIMAKGYGESMLLNRCDCISERKCTEAEHQANRRTEFRITGWVQQQFNPAFEPERFTAGQILIVTDLPDNFFSECATK